MLASLASNLLAKPQSTGFSLTQDSQNQHYNVSLVCDKPFSVGNFQPCHLDIYQAISGTIEKKSLLKNAKILLAGGMPAHHHGLPTAPVVNWSDKKNNYVIDGLKFSMPGDWELRLLIENTSPDNKPIQDKVLFKFTIYR